MGIFEGLGPGIREPGVRGEDGPALVLGEEGVDPSEARRGVAGLLDLEDNGSELFRPTPGLQE